MMRVPVSVAYLENACNRQPAVLRHTASRLLRLWELRYFQWQQGKADATLAQSEACCRAG